MTITLTDEMEELINAKVRSGEYKSAAEVVMASLRLLQAKEEGMEALRVEIMRGIKDIEEGRFNVYATDDEIESFSMKLKDAGQCLSKRIS